MAKFSVGREEDDSEGPSSPRPKKRRTTCYQSQRQQRENLTLDQQEEEVESECDEQGEEQDEEEEEEGESEHAEEEEEEGEEEGNEEESGWANTGFQSIGDRGSAGPSGDGSICVTLTDPDVLDCPICLEPLNSPVFQVCFLSNHSFWCFPFGSKARARKGKEEESYDSYQDN